MANTISNNNFFNYSDSMFSSLNSNKSEGSSNLLGDYAAIKNGSYKKLLKAYYKNQEAEESGTAAGSDEVDKNVTLLAQDAKELKSAVDALRTTGKNSLFKTKTVTTTDETTGITTESQEYDYDAIYDAAEKFIKAFNSMLDSAASVSNKTTQKKMALTDNMLRKNAGLLEDVGITVEASGKLAIDKEKFMKADINDLKTVFNGSGSIADRLSKRASDIYATAEKILSTSGGTYNRSGALNNSVKTGTIVDEEL